MEANTVLSKSKRYHFQMQMSFLGEIKKIFELLKQFVEANNIMFRKINNTLWKQ